MRSLTTLFFLIVLGASPVWSITLDGGGIPSEGLTLRATQDSATQFGDSGGTQNANGSELNQLFADIVPTVGGADLELGITGNLETNYNKLWIFFDAVVGGENVLSNDNTDAGFNEIKQLAGMTFPAGVTMDHGLRLEVGGGFYGVRFFDLITNTAQDVVTGSGSGAFPLVDVVGNKGITVGWDNSNALGVDSASAANAATATTGFEFEIDVVQAFNGSQGTINILAFVTSGDGTFASNQFLPGVASATNIGNPKVYTVPAVATVTGVVVGGSLLGDVDGDGDVDLEELVSAGDGVSDFDIIRMNWLETNASFGMNLARSDGDLNENGEVGIEDFREWKNAFNGTPEQIAAAFQSLVGVPEPSSVTLGLLAALGILSSTRKRRAS